MSLGTCIIVVACRKQQKQMGRLGSTLAPLAHVNECWVWHLRCLANSGDLLEVPSGGCTLLRVCIIVLICWERTRTAVTELLAVHAVACCSGWLSLADKFWGPLGGPQWWMHTPWSVHHRSHLMGANRNSCGKAVGCPCSCMLQRLALPCILVPQLSFQWLGLAASPGCHSRWWWLFRGSVMWWLQCMLQAEVSGDCLQVPRVRCMPHGA